MTLENYTTRETFEGSLDTLLLLNFCSKWRSMVQTSNALKQYTQSSISKSITNLLRNRLLILKDSAEDRFEQKFSNKWLWPLATRHYHFASKLDEQQSDPFEVRKYYEKYLSRKTQPSIYKQYLGTRRVRLSSILGREAPLFKTMRERITTRKFSGQSISRSQLSRIIYHTWGKLSMIQTEEFGQLLHKSSPSAGARHPIEAYVVVNKVEGVEPGIYHYSAKNNALELLRKGDFRDLCIKFSAGQTWTRETSAFFIMSAVVQRTAWKYRIPRVYRALLLDAGHLSQTFLLASTGLGLGAFCIGILSDSTIEKELGLDGVNEIALFAVGVGHRAAP